MMRVLLPTGRCGWCRDAPGRKASRQWRGTLQEFAARRCGHRSKTVHGASCESCWLDTVKTFRNANYKLVQVSAQIRADVEHYVTVAKSIPVPHSTRVLDAQDELIEYACALGQTTGNVLDLVKALERKTHE